MANRPSLEQIFASGTTPASAVSQTRPSLSTIFGTSQEDDQNDLSTVIPPVIPPSNGSGPSGGNRAPTTGEDVRKGFISGATHALPNAANATGAFFNTALEYAKGGDRKFQDFYGKGNELTEGVVGQDYQPQTTAGRYAKAAGSGLGSAPLGMGSGLVNGGRAILSGLAGGVGSEAGGDTAAGVFGEDKRVYGQVLGGIYGGAKADVYGRQFKRGVEGAAPKLAPVGKELRANADAAYKAADDAGISFDKKSFKNFVKAAADDADAQGIDVELNPGTTRLLKRFNDELKGKDPLTLSKVENLRRVTMNVSPNNPSDYRLAARLRDSLDDFVESADSNGSLISGNADGIEALKNARSSWKQLRKNEIVDGIFNKEGATNQTIKQGFRSLANSKRLKQFNPAEQEAIRKAARTGLVEQSLRTIGQLDPTGNRIGSSLGLLSGGAAVAGATPFGIAPVAGFVANRTAQGMAANSANAARTAVRQGGNRAPTAVEQLGQRTRSAFGLTDTPAAPPAAGAGTPNMGGTVTVNQGIQSTQPQQTIQRAPGQVRLNSNNGAGLAALGLATAAGAGVTAGNVEGGRRAYLADQADQMAQRSEPLEPMVEGQPQTDELGNLIQQQMAAVSEPIRFSHESFIDGLTNGVESNGERNAKNPRSSALGPYQMIRSTFASAVKKYDPETYKKGNFQNLRTDPEYARFIAIKLQEENAAALEKKGIPINETTSYLAWFANPQKTARLLESPASAPASTVFSKNELEANPFLKGKTVGQVVEWANKKAERIASL